MNIDSFNAGRIQGLLLLQRLLTDGNVQLRFLKNKNSRMIIFKEGNINLGSRLVVVAQRLINIGASESCK